MFIKIILFLCSLSLCNAKFQSETVRMTQYGPVRGRVVTSRANSSIEYFAFSGVPYAKPPLGKLRFKEPQPPKSWTKPRCALRLRDVCMQLDATNNVTGSEDCLYLTVLVPKTAGKDLKQMPVMVYLHGGNWVIGSIGTTGGDYFMEKPVIVVGMEYRLNVFGFFTTLDDNAKGNMGLKDQVQALKWVQNNIEYFNGDPTKVTIIGGANSGASIFLHMFSPLSRGLFSGGISQTGSPLMNMALQRNPMEYTRSVVEAFNIDSTDNEEIVEQLQAIDAETLITTALSDSVTGHQFICNSQNFAPVIELRSSTSFLSESPNNLLRSGNFTKVPLIVGFNSQPSEGCYAYTERGRDDINDYQNDPRLVIPQSMNIPEDSPCINTTLRNITNRYFPDGNYTNPYEWIPYISLEGFIVGVIETVSVLQNQIPIYFFYFSYAGSRNAAFLRPRGTKFFEELLYLAYPQTPGANPNETTADRLTRDRMVQLWYNFAAQRNPTPEPEELLQNVIWSTLTPRQNYLNINSTLRIQSRFPRQSEMPFWRRLYNECGFPDPDPNIIPI